MTPKQYNEYKLVLAFKKECNYVRKQISEIHVQLPEGDSSIGYMSQELKELRHDLTEVCEKYSLLAEQKLLEI